MLSLKDMGKTEVMALPFCFISLAMLQAETNGVAPRRRSFKFSAGQNSRRLGGGMISKKQLEKLRKLIAEGNEHAFYLWRDWKELAEKVRERDNHECQLCKSHGRYSHGTIVHHIKHLRERPDLALSECDPDTGERQLVTVCKHCHETEHPEAFRQFATAHKESDEFPEFWD